MSLLRIHVAVFFFVVSSIALGAPVAKKKFEARLTGASPNDDLSNLVVYSHSVHGFKPKPRFTRLGTTDRKGRFFDEHYYASPPGRPGPGFYVLPHDPRRWTLSLATNLALPSEETLGKDRRMLKEFCHKVQSEWAESDGRPTLVAKSLPQRGTVCLQTQDASGRPIANHAVQLFCRKKKFGISDRETGVLSGVTDDEGKIVLRQFPGIWNWMISFPKLGHTQTGLIIVEEGSLNEIQLPRIVPYATIRGKIHESLLESIKPEERVSLASEFAWRYRESKIDADGSFCIAEVPLGTYRVHLKNTKTQRLRIDFLDPGEDRTGLIIEPALEKKNSSQGFGGTATGSFGSEKNKKLSTLQGRLVDASGQGVAGAKVYATMKFHGGARMYQETKEATTGEQGEYEFKEVNFRFGSVALVGHVAGRPLAIAAGGYFGSSDETHVLVGIGGPTIGTTPEKPLSAVLPQPDLILPTAGQGGKLHVTTLREGMPLEGVLVEIELMDFYGSFSPGWAAGRRPDSLNQILTPSKKTNITGEAAFDHLTPGLYRITATVSNKADAPISGASWTRSSPDQILHIPVVAGESRTVRMAVSNMTTAVVPFKIRHSDRTMLTNTNTATSWKRPLDGGGRQSGSKIDDQGLGTFNLSEKGLWHLSVRYLTPSFGSNVFPLRTEPSYTGFRQVAISRLAPRKSPVMFQAHQITPATITACIEDENGKPVQGVVALNIGRYGNFQGREMRFASTDENGSVQFERVHSGTHKLQAFVPGWSTTVVSQNSDDTEFSHQFVVPEQVVEVVSGQSATVRLRRQRVAYIRGRLVPPPDVDVPISFNLTDNWTLRPCKTHIDWSRESGEFVIGPLLPGKHQVAIRRYLRSKVVSSVMHTFDLQRPGLHREDIPYRPSEIPDTQKKVSQIHGTVYAENGKTPVYAARIVVYSPGSAVSHAGAWSDASGRFALRSQLHRMARYGEETNPDGSPRQPVVVARVPGSLGATLLSFPNDLKGKPMEALKIVLPAQAMLEGNVTVAGKSPKKLPAVIRVLAQYRGRGKLDSILSVIGTANSDGGYRLEGLTPGKYDVQACLDGIWTSVSQSLEVPAKGAFKQSLNFDVPAPGDIAQYRLLDQAGKPLVNHVVRIQSLEFEGPLSQLIRPSTIKTDADGVLYLEGLSAGVHSAEFDDNRPPIEFRVPPLGSPMSVPVELRVK